MIILFQYTFLRRSIPNQWICAILFLNQVAIAFTSEEPDQLIAIFKQIEKKLGRAPEDKQKENILMDIDLLQWNDRVLKPYDLQRPYIQSALRALFDAGQENERSDQKTNFA